MKYRFDYSKLKGRIKEKCDTQANFAKEIGLSEQVLSKRLKNQVQFDSNEICKIVEVLEIAPEEINDYFFKEIVEKTQQ